MLAKRRYMITAWNSPRRSSFRPSIRASVCFLGIAGLAWVRGPITCVSVPLLPLEREERGRRMLPSEHRLPDDLGGKHPERYTVPAIGGREPGVGGFRVPPEVGKVIGRLGEGAGPRVGGLERNGGEERLEPPAEAARLPRQCGVAPARAHEAVVLAADDHPVVVGGAQVEV